MYESFKSKQLKTSIHHGQQALASHWIVGQSQVQSLVAWGKVMRIFPTMIYSFFSHKPFETDHVTWCNSYVI